MILRIYVLEKSALSREVAIHKLVENKIPVARYLYVDNSCSVIPYPYAVMEWIDGKLMREIILNKDEDVIVSCLFDAGKLQQF